MPKLKVDARALCVIKGFAIRAFHARKSFNGFDREEVQQLVILEGLVAWLKQQGVEPPFELEPEPEPENYESIEDIE